MIKLVTMIVAIGLSAQAQNLDVESAKGLFYSQNAELARGTAKGLEIARRTGRAVVMAFENTADQSGNMAAIVIQAPEQKSNVKFNENSGNRSSGNGVYIKPFNGITFDALFGTEWAPKYNDEIKRNPIVSQRVAIRMLNSRFEPYVGIDFGAEEKDRVRFGGRVLLARPDFYDYGAADFYVYSEASPGNANKGRLITNTETNIDMRYSAGAGFRWTTDEGFGVVFEGGIAYFSKALTQTNERGHRLAVGVVKSWGGNDR